MPPKHSFAFLTVLLAENTCAKLPGKIPQPPASPVRPVGEGRVTHSNCISAATGIAPAPRALNHSPCVGFTLPAQAQRSRQLEFQRKPNQQWLWLLLKTQEFKLWHNPPRAFCKFALLQEALVDYVILCAKGTHKLMSRAIISYKNTQLIPFPVKACFQFAFEAALTTDHTIKHYLEHTSSALYVPAACDQLCSF